jgi:competence protein ComEC
MWLGALGLLSFWLMLRRLACDRTASLVVLAAVAAIGGAWHHDRWSLFGEDEVGLMVTERIRPLVLEGVALHSPRWSPAPAPTALRTVPKGDETELMVRVTRVRDGQTWRPASGRAFMDIDGHLLGVQAGDRLKIMALASQPMKPLNPGEFDYAVYERSRRVLCRLRGLFPENIEVVERGGWSVRRLISYVRQRGDALLRKYIDEQRATLASAILLGAREQLDPDRNEWFLVTGTIHVLSISGLHVGILAFAFWQLFRSGLMPRVPALVTAMVLTVFYAILTDAQPPVVRATILVLVMCLARLMHQRALGFNTLALAGLIVLALQPSSLFQAGPQLSFLSVAAMILAGPVLNPSSVHDPLDHLIASSRPLPTRIAKHVGGVVWRVWLTGAIVWTVTMPLVWMQYHLISTVALVLNVVIWIPMTIAMLSGFCVLALGWLAPPAAWMAGLVCDVSLAAIEEAVGYSRDLFAGYYWLPAPPVWWVAVFYLSLAAVCFSRPILSRKFLVGTFAVLWFAFAVVLAERPVSFSDANGPGMACTFVSVGHGTGVLIETSSGRTLLYDAGHLGSPMGAVRPVSEVLWSRGLRHLDAVIISHADSDHFNGLPELAQRFKIGRVFVSPVMFEEVQPAVGELRRALEQEGLKFELLSGGDRLTLDENTFAEVLHPPKRGVIGSDNANSIVLAVTCAGRRVLLPGDLESPGFEDLLAEEPLHCDVVMAPHHGSRRSDPAGFAFWTTPNFVVISGSRDVEDEAEIRNVEFSYEARGAQVFHTQIDGCVRFEITAEGVSCRTFRGEW